MKKFNLILLLLLNISLFAQIQNISSADKINKYNYLIIYDEYTLSYNDSLGEANWVGWTLIKSDIGKTSRQNDFHADSCLSDTFNIITPNYYSRSGYDKGHLCNSQARTKTVEANKRTFSMINMIPQSPKCNRGSWKKVEDDCEKWALKGDTLLVYAGGIGSLGKLKNKVNIPKQCWKVIYGHNNKIIIKLFDNNNSEKVENITLNQLEQLTLFKFKRT